MLRQNKMHMQSSACQPAHFPKNNTDRIVCLLLHSSKQHPIQPRNSARPLLKSVRLLRCQKPPEHCSSDKRSVRQCCLFPHNVLPRELAAFAAMPDVFRTVPAFCTMHRRSECCHNSNRTIDYKLPYHTPCCSFS